MLQNKFAHSLYYVCSLISILALLLINTSNLLAQQPKALDTLILNARKIVIWSDHTWSFVIDEKGPLKSQSIIENFAVDLPDDHWETEQLYAYLDLRNAECSEFIFDASQIDRNNFTMPVIGKLYRGFGHGHTGLDIELKTGDTVVAAFDGIVRFAAYHKNGYGNIVVIRHSNGLETWYSHLSKNLVKPNQIVKTGQCVGLGGMTGRATAPHLHFETRYKDKPFDAEKIIDLATYSIKKNLGNINVCEQKKTQPKEKDTPSVDTLLSKATTHQTIDTLALYRKKDKEVILPEPPTVTAVPEKKQVSQPDKKDKTAEVKKDAKKQPAHKTYKRQHVIKKGDTLYKIAKQYNTTVEKICEANGMSEKETLKLERKLIIPD